jgi:hypothetical protein
MLIIKGKTIKDIKSYCNKRRGVASFGVFPLLAIGTAARMAGMAKKTLGPLAKDAAKNALVALLQQPSAKFGDYETPGGRRDAFAAADAYSRDREGIMNYPTPVGNGYDYEQLQYEQQMARLAKRAEEKRASEAGEYVVSWERKGSDGRPITTMVMFGATDPKVNQNKALNKVLLAYYKAEAKKYNKKHLAPKKKAKWRYPRWGNFGWTETKPTPEEIQYMLTKYPNKIKNVNEAELAATGKATARDQNLTQDEIEEFITTGMLHWFPGSGVAA